MAEFYEKWLERIGDQLKGKVCDWAISDNRILREGAATIKVDTVRQLMGEITDQNVKALQDGTKTIEECLDDISLVDLAIKPNERIESINDVRAFLRSINRQMVADEVFRQLNTQKAIAFTKEELRNSEQSPPEEKVSDDWICRWRNHASEVSTEHMQELWGRLLAGELKAPGSYSFRTMALLRNLTTSEALDIQKLAPFVISNGVMWDSGYKCSEYDRAGITFHLLMKMEDIGLLIGVGGSLARGFESEVADSFCAGILSNGMALTITHSNPKRSFEIMMCPLTMSGQEVLRLVRTDPNTTFLTQLGRHIVAKGYTVFLGNARVIPDGGVEVSKAVQL